jgi:outer membrane protein
MMKLSVKLVLTCVFIGLVGASTAWAQNGARIGYIDLERAIRSVDDGQLAMDQLQGQLQQRQELLDSAELELRRMTERLEQELEMLDDQARAQRYEEYQMALQSYQELYMNNQQELLQLEQEATQEIVERMVSLVENLAEARDLQMVFELQRSSLVWADDALDLTDALIEAYASDR